MADQSERRGFTPGPWHYKHDKYDGDEIAAEGPKWVLRRLENPDTGYHVPDIPNAADARLIAAAPDLYEALRQAVDYIAQAHEPDEPWWMRKARAALAKADGRDTGGD